MFNKYADLCSDESLETQLLDATSDEFLTDGDVLNHLDMFARGLLSATELTDRLACELQHAECRAQEIVFKKSEEDASDARDRALMREGA